MPTLLTIPFSHFCEKARWSLDHARVTYREEGHVPGLHRFAVRRARGAAGSVPVLLLDGDGAVDDSPRIVRWADACATSDSKLLPAGGRDLEDALNLERHLDIDFAPHVRRLAYFHMLTDQARLLTLMRVKTPSLENRVVRLGFPVLRAMIRRAMRIDARGAARSRDKVRAVVDEMGRRLADGRRYLMGDRFGALDITFASFAAILAIPPEHPIYGAEPSLVPEALRREAAPLLEAPAMKFVLRVYRERRGDSSLRAR